MALQKTPIQTRLKQKVQKARFTGVNEHFEAFLRKILKIEWFL